MEKGAYTAVVCSRPHSTMAGFIPGLLPTNHSQEKEFAQAYEDVLERYKGKWVKCCSYKPWGVQV